MSFLRAVGVPTLFENDWELPASLLMNYALLQCRCSPQCADSRFYSDVRAIVAL